MNTNDRPSVSLNGETPIVTEFTSSYMEGSGQVAIIPNIHVIDIDPNALIIRCVTLLLVACMYMVSIHPTIESTINSRATQFV